jgi:hypothetical protein
MFLKQWFVGGVGAKTDFNGLCIAFCPKIHQDLGLTRWKRTMYNQVHLKLKEK